MKTKEIDVEYILDKSGIPFSVGDNWDGGESLQALRKKVFSCFEDRVLTSEHYDELCHMQNIMEPYITNGNLQIGKTKYLPWRVA